MIDPSDYHWGKSSYSGGNGDCVEVGQNGGPLVGVRDTKANGQGPILAIGRWEWSDFLTNVKAGKFNRP